MSLSKKRSSTDPLAPVYLHHDSGASATIYPYGATVTSFETASKRELLFVSSSAKLDGSKAIRGGIPLVFPQFGHPDKSYPQHGFLRRNVWTVVDTNQHDDDVDNKAACCELTLQLKDVKEARGGKWDVGTGLDCTASMLVKIEAEKLTTTLTVTNTGETSFDFQTLFHTYYKVEDGKALDKDLTYVEGLKGYLVEDKVTNEEYTQDDQPIIVDREVDRIYRDVTTPVLDVVIQTGAGKKVGLQAKAKVGETEAPVSVVVWNPYIEKAKGMSDFTDEQYHDMICVEPGLLHDVPTLFKEAVAVFEQVITAL